MRIKLCSTIINSDEPYITIDEDRVKEIQDVTERLQADIDLVCMSCDEDSDSQPVADAIARVTTRLTEAQSMVDELKDLGIEFVREWSVYEDLCEAVNDAGSILVDTCIMPEAIAA